MRCFILVDGVCACGVCAYSVQVYKVHTCSFHAHNMCTCNVRVVLHQEAKYVERWLNTTSAWAGWSRFDIPVDRYD
jgi:hypothetical protein